MGCVTGAVPDPLPDWLTGATRICVLTGAGVSTDGGIPDYRGPERRLDPRPGRREARDALLLRGRSRDPPPGLADAPRSSRSATCTPTPRHEALADLERPGPAARADHPERRRVAPGGRIVAGRRPGDPRHRARGCVPVLRATGRRCAAPWTGVDAGDARPRAACCAADILKSATVMFGERSRSGGAGRGDVSIVEGVRGVHRSRYRIAGASNSPRRWPGSRRSTVRG